ncbi:hypothetical protein E2562_016681 [Oryza meyeriana var. granulata]|uniref:Uncharacterized protein n=1 Tax=Oryza meyeriana var. granulata TaxID=110450 RepID=A0A6G1EL59_9ORYZ|nr:hypothetical protein E2562_016681 [Oryza meyeriana var. granulata]
MRDEINKCEPTTTAMVESNGGAGAEPAQPSSVCSVPNSAQLLEARHWQVGPLLGSQAPARSHAGPASSWSSH